MSQTDETSGVDEPALVLPEPSVPDPASAPGLRWGVVSPGHIAGQFTDTAHRATASRIVSVVSRSAERAAAFAAEHGIERSFDSVEGMLASGGIDAEIGRASCRERV